LLAHVDALLSTDQALAELDPPEAGQLRGLGPRIAQICDRLLDYRVPQTLVHGDLHLGNVAGAAEQFVFFDWTDACVAHPFFDLTTMLNSAEENLGSFQAARARLADVYLGAWTDYEPIERLREACALALPLGALHQAVSYWHILTAVEASAREEWAGATGYWLRKALALMPVAAGH
ncbi:MAG TPA: phosphotransferase, partial [Roseiflexaceae bacterium]|nr:phosphotransferase [Roseiflexaceae bacterium]